MLSLFGAYEGVDFIIVAIAFLFAIIIALSFHEFAHAFVAYKCGDTTPKMQGRITLNPLKHIEPIGFLCCALFGFGWAKPVKVQSINFRNFKKGNGLTAVAGVAMNLILAFIGCGFYSGLILIQSQNIFLKILIYFFYYTYIINICLAVFNILPIYPLDGFKLVENYTKYGNSYVEFMYKYGTLVLLGIVFIFDDLLSLLIGYVSLPIQLFWKLIF